MSRTRIAPPVAPTCPPEHRHDTNCYNQHRCRCGSCRDALATYARDVRKQKAYGRWDARARHDVAPVAEHIAQLKAFGYSYEQIAHAAGVNSHSVYLVAHDRLKFVHGRVAHAILAVEPSLRDLGPGTLIDARGARRRLQALACMGWAMSTVAHRSGLAHSTVVGASTSEQVTLRTHDAIATVFEELWCTPAPNASMYERRSATVARARAARAGWLPPAAWDDIDQDDEPPTVAPVKDAAIEPLVLVQMGIPARLTREDRLMVVAHRASHLTAGAIAALVECDIRTIQRDLKELDLVDVDEAVAA